MLTYSSSRYCPFDFSVSLQKIRAMRSNFERFNRALLQEELVWINQFLSCLHDHLNQRTANGFIIAHETYIQAQFSEISADIQFLLITQRSVEKIFWPSISHYIRKIIISLAKLGGARAFLRGNILEMLYTFELINHIYWGTV